MKYRKDPWYIAGIIITVIAALTIAVTMVFMYYGNDIAIIWCFGAMPVLAIGFLLSQSVKRRYEDADARNGEPLPMFWRIRFSYHNLKVLVITKGIWRVMFAGLTAFFLAVALLLGVICGINALSKNSIVRNPEYIECGQNIDKYMALYSDARRENNEELAHEYYLKIEEYEQMRENSEKYIKSCEETISNLWPWIAVSGALALFCGVTLSAYALHKRNVERLPLEAEPTDPTEPADTTKIQH